MEIGILPLKTNIEHVSNSVEVDITEINNIIPDEVQTTPSC